MAIHGVRDISIADFFSRKRKLTVVFGAPMTTEEIFGNVKQSEGENHYQSAAQNILERVRSLIAHLPVC
jgi:hypothetical protein